MSAESPTVDEPAIRFELRRKVAWITIDRPGARNALNSAMSFKLIECFREVQRNTDIWLAVLTATDPVFCAGADLKEKLDTLDTRTGPPASDLVYQVIHETYKPVITAVNGPCIAQGTGMALLSDIVIMSDKSCLGWPQVKRGISSMSGPLLLADMLPRNVALRYLLTGDFIQPEDALRLNLVTEVAPHGELLAVAQAWADRIVRNAPLAARAIKEAAVRGENLSYDDRYAIGRRLADWVYGSDDAREGLAAFREKRAARWTGR